MYRINMPDCPRDFCVIAGDKRYFIEDSPYCDCRCNRHYNPTRQTYKTLKGGIEHG